jgi:hypothetical protein
MIKKGTPQEIWFILMFDKVGSMIIVMKW